MKKILIVDDDQPSRDVITRFIEKQYEVLTAVTPEEALEMISKYHFDVILMDIGLGYGMNGIILTQKIREIKGYKEVPVIAVTAYATSFDRENILSSGLDDYISKPFNREAILNVIEKALNKKRD
jgi:CheY-like chemotaxis protein